MATIVIVAGLAASEFPVVMSLIRRLRAHGHYIVFAGVSAAETIVSSIGVDFFPIKESAPDASLAGDAAQSLPAMTSEALFSLFFEQAEGLVQLLQFANPAAIVFPVQLAAEALLLQTRFSGLVAILTTLPSTTTDDELQHSIKQCQGEPRWNTALHEYLTQVLCDGDIFSHILARVRLMPRITVECGSPNVIVSNRADAGDHAAISNCSLEQLI